MQTFEIKRGHGKTLEDGGLKNIMKEVKLETKRN